MKREEFFGYIKNIATLGRVGYFPASGTVATAATVPLMLLIKLLFSPRTEFFILLIATFVSGFIIDYVLARMPRPLVSSDALQEYDPPHIVLDELIGCLWAFYGITISWNKLVVGFFLFRFFDIFKPFGIDALQRLPGAWGILADDVLAGLYTALILFFI